MTDKTMPERIYAWGANDLPRWSADNMTDDAVEYVRADLISDESASSVPPLEVGQLRWVKHGGAWHIATTHKSAFSEKIVARVGMKIPVGARDLEAIGPLITMPDDEEKVIACI